MPCEAVRMPRGWGQLMGSPHSPGCTCTLAWEGVWVLPELMQERARLSRVCLCMQRRACWGRSGRLVIYHCSVMGALLLVKEVSLPARYQTPSLLTSC